MPTSDDIDRWIDTAVEHLAEEDAAFQQRFDLARMVLERKYRWAKRTLRNLHPVRRDEGTLAVDKYLRLYHGPVADTWTDKEFVGALWHEVNHLLRHHPERLENLPKTYHTDPVVANLAADMEINDDLRDQGMALPEGLVYSVDFGHEPNVSAEQHFFKFVEDMEPTPDPQPGDQAQPGQGQADPTKKPAQAGPQQGSNETGDGKKPPGKQPQPGDDPGCGSGAGGGEQPDELPAPSEEDLDRLDRAQRQQDEDVVEASQAGQAAGLTGGIIKAAIERIGRSAHDWRRTFATEVRNALEQRADEAEEYTFRRRSRRAGMTDEFILPGSFRPIPQLGVVVDVSGSMDKAKLTAAMREVHGILERLAIPSFTAYPTNQNVLGSVTVQTAADIKRVFEEVGGGTDMQKGIAHSLSRGDEVIIVLTDCECRWNKNGPMGVPVVIGGINRRRDTPPRWARLVDVEGGPNR